LFINKFPLCFLVILFIAISCGRIEKKSDVNPVWPVEKALAWQEKTGWLSGCNFIPSTAVNAIEMWQKGTFDPSTIDRELGRAENLGFNIMRVWLNSLVWESDPYVNNPKLWFHDILRANGTPFDQVEIDTIKVVNMMKE